MALGGYAFECHFRRPSFLASLTATASAYPQEYRRCHAGISKVLAANNFNIKESPYAPSGIGVCPVRCGGEHNWRDHPGSVRRPGNDQGAYFILILYLKIISHFRWIN